jgi:hypothetical protein
MCGSHSCNYTIGAKRFMVINPCHCLLENSDNMDTIILKKVNKFMH